MGGYLERFDQTRENAVAALRCGDREEALRLLEASTRGGVR